MTDLLADKDQLRADAALLEVWSAVAPGFTMLQRAAAALRLAANVHGTRAFPPKPPSGPFAGV